MKNPGGCLFVCLTVCPLLSDKYWTGLTSMHTDFTLHPWGKPRGPFSTPRGRLGPLILSLESVVRIIRES